MSDSPKKVLLLGSTGSIGCQVVDVARQHPDRVRIVGLAAGSRVDDIHAQARELDVHDIAIGSEDVRALTSFDELRAFSESDPQAFFGCGSDALCELIDKSDADIVVNSLVGAAGLEASLRTIGSGKSLALANKESLVVGGDLIMPLVAKLDELDGRAQDGSQGYAPSGRLTPIDSEHGAIFQCLLGERMDEVQRLWVTASGGPFRGMKTSELRDMDAAAALAHPTWNMGPKITIDSSTLMNKGLEVIEAHHLFDMSYDKIEVVVQPQSAIHSMVEFSDGSVKAHLGTTDMRIPIQFALSYPDRWSAPVKPMDFRTLGSLDFEAPDTDTFRCLALAKEAGTLGGTMPCAMNAANEVAVAAFLAGECSFLDIADTVERVMDSHDRAPVVSLEQLLEVDGLSREAARGFIFGK